MEKGWVRGGLIGKGSFGTVSLALDRSNGTIFAVKSINLNSSPPRAVAAMENEIRLLPSLNSPHVITYLGDDITDEPGGWYRNLHMEYLPGGTAADLAAAAGKMTEADVRGYTRSIVRALQYLHTSAGVAHGDVKGRNVLLGSPTGAAKLADFGSARKGLGDAAAGGGTPLWMAPEVARGQSASPAADVWSLGCTVIEMVSGGRPPWGKSGIAGSDPLAQMFRIGFREVLPEFPLCLSKAGRDFLDKCLRRDAGERWTCEQLLRHSFLADSPEPSPRSVFELGESELEFEDDEDGYTEDGDCEVESSRERIRDLGSSEVKWGGDGWVEVRSAGASGASGVGELSGSRVEENVGVGGVRWFGAIFLALLCCNEELANGITCNFPFCSFAREKNFA